MDPAKKYTWYKIAESAAAIFNDTDSLKEITVNGKKICVVKRSDDLRACAAKCPHAGGTMADGYTDAVGNIVCPLHRYKFSLENGRNISGEGYFLKTYPIKEDENGLFVGIEEKTSFWSW